MQIEDYIILLSKFCILIIFYNNNNNNIIDYSIKSLHVFLLLKK